MRGLASALAVALQCFVCAGLGDISFTFLGNQSETKLAENFNRWIDDNGGAEWSKIKVEVIPGFRLGAVARTDIAVDDLYLKVPWRMVISEDSISQSDVGRAFESIRRRHDLDIGDYLLLYLLHERFRGDSFWQPYIDVLPREYNIPFYWSAQELEELKGTGMPEAVSEYLSEHRNSFVTMKRLIKQEAQLKAVAAKFDWELFMWASSVVDSRTIWINGRKRTFLPMLDMVNDQDHPSRVHRTSFDTQRQVTQTRAIWRVPKGQQLFENYGSANFHNLLYHGFILEHNSYDSAKMQLPTATGKVHNLLQSLGVPRDHEVKAGEAPPISLMADARIRAMEKNEVEDALAGRARHNYGAPLSTRNEQAAVKIVLKGCTLHINASYKTAGIDADVKILQDKELSANVRSAVTFRFQQKKLIMKMCDTLRQQHDEL